MGFETKERQHNNDVLLKPILINVSNSSFSRNNDQSSTPAGPSPLSTSERQIHLPVQEIEAETEDAYTHNNFDLSSRSTHVSTPSPSFLLTSMHNQSSSIDDVSLSTSEERIHSPVICHAESLISERNMPDRQINEPRNSSCNFTLNDNEIINPPKDCKLCNFSTNLRSEYVKHIIIHFQHLNKSGGDASQQSPAVANSIMIPNDSRKLSVASNKRETRCKRNAGKKDDKLKTCQKCYFVASSKDEYWLHMRKHTDEDDYRCPECYFITIRKHHMIHHWLSIHDILKVYNCDKCNYACVNNAMLSSHMKSHLKFFQYTCGNCSYETRFLQSMKKHVKELSHREGKILDTNGQLIPEATLESCSRKRKQHTSSARSNKRRKCSTISTVASSSRTPSDFSIRPLDCLHRDVSIVAESVGYNIPLAILIGILYPVSAIRNLIVTFHRNIVILFVKYYQIFYALCLVRLNELREHENLERPEEPKEYKEPEETDEPLDLSMPKNRLVYEQRQR